MHAHSYNQNNTSQTRNRNMGIRDLWSLLEPYSERRSLAELEGKVVAVDLAGWVCESLNLVDYQISPRMYLKWVYNGFLAKSVFILKIIIIFPGTYSSALATYCWLMSRPCLFWRAKHPSWNIKWSPSEMNYSSSALVPKRQQPPAQYQMSRLARAAQGSTTCWSNAKTWFGA